MKIQNLTTTIMAALLAIPLVSGTVNAYELTLPSFDYRTGPYAPNGIPFANGYGDYMNMLNERDGGINDTKIKLTACETAYNTKRGVECYESTKGEEIGRAHV